MARFSNHTQIPQFGHLTGSEGGEFVFFTEGAARLPTEVEAALYARNKHVRRGAVAALIAMAKSAEGQEAALAEEWLQRLGVSDLDPTVREAARSYFEEREARSSGDAERLSLAMRVQQQAENIFHDPERLKLPGLQDVARLHQRIKEQGSVEETKVGARFNLAETQVHIPAHRRPTRRSSPTRRLTPEEHKTQRLDLQQEEKPSLLDKLLKFAIGE
jgi:hypothetical protein